MDVEALCASFHANDWAERWGAQSAGRYSVAQATIWLPAWINLFERDGKLVEAPPPHAVAVFLHEYLHYLHNCSTLVGVEQLVSSLTLAGIYGRTLDPDHSGRSQGQAALDIAHVALLERLRTSFRHFVLPGNSAADYATAQSLKVTGWNRVLSSSAPEDNVLMEAVLHVQVSKDGCTAPSSLLLSVDLIEEGLALIYEELFLLSEGLEPSPAPFYPYHVLRCVVRTYCPDASLIDIFRLGMISMNATNPGVQLMESLQLLGPSISIDSSHIPERLNWSSTFPAVISAMQHKLDLVQAMFLERGLVEHGVTSVFERCRELLKRRLTDPFFELAIRESTLHRDDVFELVREVVPCEVVVHGMGGDPKNASDPILTFAEETDKRRVEGRRAMHLQVHSALTHLDHGLSFVPSASRTRECPYYSSCSHPAREENDPLCATRPWETVHESDKNRCWYASGILALMAKVRIDPR